MASLSYLQHKLNVFYYMVKPRKGRYKDPQAVYRWLTEFEKVLDDAVNNGVEITKSLCKKIYEVRQFKAEFEKASFKEWENE